MRNFILLILILQFSSLNLFAQQQPSLGSGTLEDPYQIENLAHLRWLSEGGSDGTSESERWASHYILTANIDASETSSWNSGVGFKPIGNDTQNFTGTFNGQENVISGLTIKRPAEKYIGLFGFLSVGGVVEHLGLIDVNTEGANFTAGLVAKNKGGTISKCYVSGSVTSTAKHIGGLVGDNASDGSNIGTVSQSYSFTSVTGNENVGGLVGRNNTNSIIQESYAVGLISGNAKFGGLLGLNYGTIEDSFWDTDVSGISTPIDTEVGLTTAEFGNASNFSTWNFTSVWTLSTEILDINVRPYLFIVPTVVEHDITVNTGANGSISPETSTVLDGEDATFSITAAVGYEISGVLVDGVSVGAVESYTFENVTTDHTLSASFVKSVYTITVTSGNHGQISPSTASISFDEEVTFSITADVEYEVYSVLVNGVDQDAITTYKFSDIFEDQSIEAIFIKSGLTVATVPTGTGDIADPYQISTLSELRWLSEGIDGGMTDADRWNKHYVLTSNIDASETEHWNLESGFRPIGNNGNGLKFFGSFDGQEHVISNLTIDRSTEKYIGLFGYLKDGAEVKNLGLIDVSISGQNFTGGLIGKNEKSTVSQCYVSGSITSTNKTVGGLVGDNANEALVSKSYSFADVSGVTNVGGIVGGNYSSSSISECYAVGYVTGTTALGGLIGLNNSGLSFTDSYWDIETTNQSISAGSDESLFGLTTAEFSDATQFIDWDFTSDWAIYSTTLDANPRPYLFIDRFTVSVTENVGGSISPSTTEFLKGENQIFTIEAATGYEVADVLVDGASVGVVESYTFNDISTDHTISATFEKVLYTITATVGDHGQISPSSASLYFDEEITFTITPDLEYEVYSVLVNGEDQGAITSYTFRDIYEGQSIEVTFIKSGLTEATIPTGTGDISDPYQISNLSELRWLSEGIDSGMTDADRWNKHYVLTSNIDASETVHWNSNLGFRPIGNDTDNFSGSFDGQEFVIDGLTMVRSDEKFVGLFGVISSGEVQNLGLTSVDIEGKNAVGSIAGKLDGANIESSYASGSVQITTKNGGGLVGSMTNGSILEKAYSFVNVDGLTNTGGLVGANYGSTIRESYAVGSVLSTEASVGGLAGLADGSSLVETSYWDVETTTQSISSGSDESLFGLTTAEFSDATQFIDWDFTSDWAIYSTTLDANPRPYLFIDRFTVSVTENVGGSISPGTTEFLKGENQIFTIEADAGYEVADVLVNGASIGVVESYTFNDISSDHTISATFEKVLYTITATAGDHGQISPSSASLYFDEEVTFTITPDLEYEVYSVLVNGEDQGVNTTYTFRDIYEGQSIEVIFIKSGLIEATIPTGAGDISDPYQISNLSELRWLSEGIDSGMTDTDRWNKHYVLTSNIDASETVHWNSNLGFRPIGNDTDNFSGSFNGQEFVIDGLTLARGDEKFVGLFGVISSGQVQNLGLTSVDIEGKNAVGSIAGKLDGANIESSYASGSVQIITKNGGGLVGSMTNGSVLEKAYSFVNVDGLTNTGGLVGANYGSTIRESYAVGSVLSTEASVGGLAGLADGSSLVENSYWDIETTTQSNSFGSDESLFGLITAEFSDATQFIDWDFTSDWAIYSTALDANPRPYLFIDRFTVSVTENVGGSISPGTTEFLKGENQIFTIEADAGYEVADVLVDGASVGVVESYTFNDISTDHTISATFEKVPYTITATAGDHGQISPSSASLYFDEEVTFTITPDLEYEVYSVLVNGEEQGAITSYTFRDIYEDQSIEVIFIKSGLAEATIPTGTGDITDPYHISNLSELRWLSEGIDGGMTDTDRWSKHYILTSNIDASETVHWNFDLGFNPIGNDTDNFSGSFNGQEFKIEGLSINRIDDKFVGLFGVLSNAEVQNLGLTEVNIIGKNAVGALAGKAESTTIYTSYASGELLATTKNGGGLVGSMTAGSILQKSYSFVNVEGLTNTGGLVGANYGSTIDECYAVGSVVSSENSKGGIVGLADGSSMITNTFWDTETSSITSAKSTEVGLATIDFSDSSNFVDWDFSSDWAIYTTNLNANPRPYLFIDRYTVSVSSGLGGRISPTSSTVVENGNQTFTIVADAGYILSDVLVDGSSVGAVESYTFENVTGDHTISASFEKELYTITASAGSNGQISPSTESIYFDEEKTFTISADLGFEVYSVSVNGVDQGAITEYTFRDIYENQNIEAVFIRSAVAPTGNGTFTDPYLISSLAGLRWLSENTDDVDRLTKHYVLTDTIDASETLDWHNGKGFVPIGDGTHAFTGSFNGQTNLIQGLVINRENEESIGLFGHLKDGAKVRSIGLVDSNIKGKKFVGGIAGKSEASSIEQCFVTGKVEATDKTVGSLVGDNFSNAFIYRAYSLAGVIGDSNVGGLVGRNTTEAMIKESFAVGQVIANSKAGGLIGINYATVLDSYWDKETTGQLVSSGSDESIYGLNTVEFADSNNFPTWDFEHAWEIGIEEWDVVSRPYLYTNQAQEFVIDVIKNTEGVYTYEKVFLFRGESLEFRLGQRPGYVLSNLLVNGDSLGPLGSYIFKEVEENHTIEGEFERELYQITVLPTEHGSIDLGNTEIYVDEEKNFQFTPEVGYEVFSILVNGKVKSPSDSYTFSNVTKDQTLEVLFTKSGLTLASEPENGDGSVENPYEIGTLAELRWLSEGGNGAPKNSVRWAMHYILTDTINAIETREWNAGYGFTPIGDDNNKFKGTFDGQGNYIDSLYIQRETGKVGLFGQIKEAKIKRVNLRNAEIEGSSVVGGLVGKASWSIIENVSVTGGISAVSKSVGGVVGELTENSVLLRASSFASVYSPKNVGGLVGANYSSSLVQSYAVGLVNGSDKTGGLIGIENTTATVLDSYWDRVTTGQLVSAGSDDTSGLSTADFEVATNFENWNFVDVWNIELKDEFNNTPRPYLLSVEPSNTYSITVVESDSGQISPTTIQLAENERMSFNIVPNKGFEIEQLKIDGVDQGVLTKYTFDAIQSNHEIEAKYKEVVYNISLSYSINGTVTESDTETPLQITFDDSRTFTFMPEDGYEVSSVLVNGKEKGVVTEYTFTDVFEDQTLEVFFTKSGLTLASMPAKGYGTIDDPYQIETLSNLRWLSEGGSSTSNDLASGSRYFLLSNEIDESQNTSEQLTGRDVSTKERWNSHYILIDNINASGSKDWNSELGFSPIGTEDIPFKGTFNGQGFTIDSLVINRPNDNNIGLFGFTEGTYVEQVGLTNVSVTANAFVGGLVGKVYGSTIERTYVSGNISVTDKNVGGLVGELNKGSLIHKSYSLTNVFGAKNVGGLVGAAYTSDVLESYAVGQVLGSSNTGGLVGTTNSSAQILKSYWDKETSNQASSSASADAFGLITSEFNTSLSFEDWNFENSWKLENISSLDSVARPHLFLHESLPLYTIEVLESEGGQIRSRTLQMNQSDSVRFKIQADAGYQIADVLVDDESQGALSAYTFVDVNSSQTISATFDKIDYTITFITDKYGSVDSGDTTIQFDEVKTFNFLPEDGYEVYSVKLNGEEQLVSESYTFKNIFANQTLEVFFIKSGLAVATEPTMGTGTDSDPYQISNLSELRWLSEGLETGMSDSVRWSKHYLVTENIDASETFHWNLEEGFSPIGTDKIPFTGSLNGQGFEIDSLTINRSEGKQVGLFGFVSDAHIHQLGLTDVSLLGKSSIGGLAGKAVGSIIERVYVSGDLESTEKLVGGIVGELSKNSFLHRSYSFANIVGLKNNGGLVGACYTSNILESYAVGKVLGEENNGGLVGQVNSTAKVEKSYWDTETTQQTVSAGSKAKFGLISENFAADSSFVDWNLDVVWSLETVSELDSLVRPYLFRDGNTNVHFISVADSVGGSISPRSLSLTEGETRVYKIKAENGYQIVDVFVDSVSQGALSEYTFVEVSSAHSISASFEKIPYEITVNVGNHGEVDSSSTTIFYDEVKTFKFTADEGYEVHSVYVNGEDLGVISEYTFQDIFANQTLEVFFIKSGLAVATEPTIGTGTISDPYQISNLSELRWLSEGLETGMSDSVRWSKHYLVTENINASETFHWNLEEGFSPIGTDKVPFTGSLNGQGFEVDSLTINRSEGKQIGLFGFVSDAHIHQLGLTDVSLLGKSSVGGLVGKAVGSIIERVYVSGDIESTEKSIGGLIGEIGKNTFVHRSYSLANVTGIRNVGGLLGACYNSSVLESYAVGIVSGNENIGGLIGQTSSAVIEKSYWDTVTTQQTVSAGSKAKFGLSSENFAADSSFVDWNVDVVWTLETVSELDSLVRPYLFQDGNTNVHFISVADSVGGSISPRSLSLTEGETRVYKIKSENGYQIVDVFVDSVSQGALSEYTFVEVSSAHSISASFEKIPYEITVNVGSHGEVDSSSTTIFYDEVKTFKFIADEGYEIYSVYVNGEDLGVISEYTFQDIFANQTLEVFFIKSGLVVATELTMGSGTISDPYQISNLSELRWLSEGLETGMSDSVRWSKHYVVTENINASEAFHWNLEEGFSPIGTDKIPFTGSLNGQGFEIDSLTINRSEGKQVGLFGFVSDAHIHQLGLTDVSLLGKSSIGGLAGKAVGSIIERVYVSGDLESTEKSIGGLIGEIGKNTFVHRSYSLANVTGIRNVGGLLGACYNSSVLESYAVGIVSGNENVGGLIGQTSSAVIEKSYWDTETTQQTVSAGSKAKFGLISENFAADSSFVDWNVDVVWSLETVSELDSLVRPYLFRDGNANVHFISVADSVGGSISPRSLSLTEGETRVYKIKADNGYQIVDVFVDSVSQGALSEYTFVEVSSAHSISASFEKIPYEITVNVGSHGEVDSSSTTIFYDEVKTFKFTADEGYEVHSVYVNGEDLGVISEYTFQDIFTDQTLEVFFIKSGLAVATEPAIGTGTDSDPYQISNLSELRWLSEGLETGMSDSVRWSKHYLVTENIDASETFHWNLEEGFSSIGTDKIPFTGSLNGQGFKIDSLTINRSEGKQIGLFGFVSDAHIHQLGLKDISLLGKSSVGGLAGKAVGSIIERVYVSGDLESTEKSIGGLIGEIGKNTFVHRSFSLANVTGIRNVGGLLGACYNSSVLESYAVGKVLGEENNGGLVGQVNSTAKVEKSYWDTETTQQTVSAGSKAKFGLISENFAADSSFVDWNLDVVWSLETVSELDSLVRPYLFRDGNTNVHFISVADSVGGSISPRSLSLTEGETRVYKIKAENGYQIVDVFVDSVSQGALSEYTFVEVSSAHSISASFEKIPYEITVNVGNHGEVDSSSTTIFYDEVKTFKFTADEGYEVHSVYVNGEDLGVISEYTFQDIFANQTLEVFFIKSGLAVATEPTIGTGTISDPYQISNLSELRWLSEGLETGMSDSVRWSKHYLVTENIDASETFHWNLEEGFSPIGTDKIPFTGSLNGQGFEIDSLTINRPEAKYVGLFGFAEEAVIKKLKVKDVSIDGFNFVGGIAGKVKATILEKSWVSGLITSSNKSVGGILGEIADESILSKVYSYATVIGNKNVGGLAGANYTSLIQESYAVGHIEGAQDVGGLVGNSNSSASVVNAYWDIETTGQLISSASEKDAGLETLQFADTINFKSWDFEKDWKLKVQTELDSVVRPHFFDQSTVDSYIIRVKGTKNGVISPGSIEVNEGESKNFEFIAEQGYKVSNVWVDGDSIGSVENYEFSNVQDYHTIEATFEKALYSIEVLSEGNGTLSLQDTTMVFDDIIELVFTPEVGYTILDVLQNEVSLGRVETLNLTDIYEDQIIRVIFGDYPIYTIPALAGENGSIYPEIAEVVEGQDQLFEIIPEEGYEVQEVFIDSMSVGAITEYLFESVAGDRTISAIFKKIKVLDAPEGISVNIYPNPTSRIVNIQNIEKGKSVVVYSVLGKEVLQLKSDGTLLEIDLKGLDTGVYFIQIEDVGVTKVVKE